VVDSREVSDIALGRLVEVERARRPLRSGEVLESARVTLSGALQHFGVERVRFVYWDVMGDCLDDLVVGDDVLVFGSPFTLDCEDLAIRGAMERDGGDFVALAHELGFTTNPIGLR
jgi:hypothetical protein